MLAQLKQLFTTTPQALSAEEQETQLHLAAISLLIEVVYADDTLDDAEANLLPSLISSELNIEQSQATALIAEAKVAQKNSTSLYEFTNQINEHFSLQQKQQLILAMWKLAYADGQLCRYEDQIIRRTAELLYLKHSELIQMRNAAIR